jgi:hypothetical protein
MDRELQANSHVQSASSKSILIHPIKSVAPGMGEIGSGQQLFLVEDGYRTKMVRGGIAVCLSRVPSHCERGRQCLLHNLAYSSGF